MIECKNISVCYEKNRPVIKNVSLTVSDGRICVLLGHNGCGKTTLIKAITGELRVDGDAIIDNIPLNKLKHTELAQKLSVLPQILPLPSGVSVREAVAFGRTPYTGYFGRLSSEDNAMIDRAIDAMGISHLDGKNITEISGGERQKVFLSMLIAKDSQNIILDEPTSNLDSKNKRELFDFIRSMKNERRAILAVLHDVNDALSVADDICVMSEGKTVFFGNTDEFIKSGIAEKEFGLKPIIADDSGEKRIFFT